MVMIVLVCSIFFLTLNLLIIPILAVLGRVRRGGAAVPAEVRRVSIIIPAFNEADTIVRKLDQVRGAVAGLAIPAEVLVGSDGSTDATCELANQFIAEHQLAGWRVLALDNQGKGQTLNRLVAAASGDLVVSTDADVGFDAAALAAVVQAFEDDARLGCLSSVPVFQGRRMPVQRMYWRYEMALRDAASRLGRLVVVTGWLYAYRKALFRPIPEKVMADDLWVPLTILLAGHDCRHHPQARALSEPTDESTEVRRRRRVIAGGVDVVARLWPELLRHPGLLLIVFAHKINRWLLPLWVSLAVLNIILLWPQTVWPIAGLALLAALILRRRFLYLFHSLIAPVFSINKIDGKRDLSKWQHTRVTGE